MPANYNYGPQAYQSTPQQPAPPSFGTAGKGGYGWGQTAPPPLSGQGQNAPPLTGTVPTDAGGFTGTLPLSQGVQQLIDLIKGQGPVVPQTNADLYGAQRGIARQQAALYGEAQGQMQQQYGQLQQLAQQMTALYQNRAWEPYYNQLIARQQAQMQQYAPVAQRSQAFYLYGY